MKNVKNENNFLVICGACILIVLMMFYFSFNVSYMEFTTSFGGVTGSLAIPYNVTYSSNWPDSSFSNETSVYSDKKQHIILDNMFNTPDGYEFVGWNTLSDGSGVSYKVNDTMPLENNVDLYAQWVISNDKEKIISYGDVNLNGVIDENDYVIIYNHILGTNVLDGQALLNADVNNDGIINTVDVDIVEQAFKGTEGYTGYLPNSPVLIYELYDDGVDVEDGSDNVIDEPSDSSGTGSGTTGNGSGNSSGNVTSGNTGSPNKGQNSTSNDFNSSKVEGSEGSKDDSKTKIYEFKFISDDKEYAITTCDVLDDGTCELVFPNVIPSKSGYIFSGWSLTKGCSTGNGLITPVIVSESNTYYACFNLDYDEYEDNKFSYTWIIVIMIWIIAILFIYRLINYYKNKDN